jgi:hypothetical protein
MTPQQFIAKWRASELSERSAYQQHYCDLCDLLGQAKPEADPAHAHAHAKEPSGRPRSAE